MLGGPNKGIKLWTIRRKKGYHLDFSATFFTVPNRHVILVLSITTSPSITPLDLETLLQAFLIEIM